MLIITGVSWGRVQTVSPLQKVLKLKADFQSLPWGWPEGQVSVWSLRWAGQPGSRASAAAASSLSIAIYSVNRIAYY